MTQLPWVEDAMLWKVIFSAVLALTLSGCATPDGNSVGSADTYHPSFQDGKADSPGVDTDVTSNNIDAVGSEDGATDEPDTSCIPDPKMIDRVETACKGNNGKAIWKYDSTSCTWRFGDFPNADPAAAWDVPNKDLPLAREYFGCPPIE